MFDFSQPPALLWQKLFDYQLKFHRLANAAIESSPVTRDKLEQECINWILCDYFDSIQGGFYIEDGEHFEYSLQCNLLAAELLASADKVLLHGELYFNAQKVLDSVAARFAGKGCRDFVERWRYTKMDVPIYASGDYLIDRLQSMELSLLQALIDKPILTGQDYYLCWRLPLQQAAKKAGVHFKQAQIVQQAICSKIQSNTELRNSQYTTRQSLELIDFAKLLTTFSHVSYWYGTTRYLDFLRTVEKKIFDLLNSSSRPQAILNSRTKIELCFALVEYLQIVPSTKTLNLLAHLVKGSRFNDFSEYTQTNWYQFYYVQSVLAQYEVESVDYIEQAELSKDVADLVSQLKIRKFAQSINGHAEYQQLASRFSLTQKGFFEIN